jgi:hypothetical protein
VGSSLRRAAQQRRIAVLRQAGDASEGRQDAKSALLESPRDGGEYNGTKQASYVPAQGARKVT